MFGRRGCVVAEGVWYVRVCGGQGCVVGEGKGIINLQKQKKKKIQEKETQRCEPSEWSGLTLRQPRL